MVEDEMGNKNKHSDECKKCGNDEFLYFAYGSNMLVKKLTSRCKSAKKINPTKDSQYMIREHEYGFFKRSEDGSGKGDIKETGKKDDKVYGVLFCINNAEEILLDRAEGLGYGGENIGVIDEKINEKIEAKAYFAQNPERELEPYDWYKRQTVQGAKDNGLPEKYIKKIEAKPSKPDDDEDRIRKEEKYF